MDKAPKYERIPFTTESDLVARLKSHDETAFKELLNLYYSGIVTVLRWYTKDEKKITKGVEKSFLATWKHIQDYNCSQGTLFTWVLNQANQEGAKLSRRKGLKIVVMPPNGFSRCAIFPSLK
jgi:DNA-directed RNA polymerase specialized sigma24 family protein